MRLIDSAINKTAYRLMSESFQDLRAEVAAFAQEALDRGVSHAEAIALVTAYQKPAAPK